MNKTVKVGFLFRYLAPEFMVFTTHLYCSLKGVRRDAKK